MKHFNIQSGSMIISDPCYTPDTWCMGKVENVSNGLWMADVDIDTRSGRIASIICYNNAAQIRNPNITSLVYKAPEMPFVVGVDSGQAGFFDAKFYRDDESIGSAKTWDDYERTESGDKFYSACCYATLDEAKTGERFGTIPFGAVSSSGWGDGSYKCLGEKDPITNEYIAFVIIFIDDNDNEDDGFGSDEDDDPDDF